ncbi:hypothetical protein INN88_15105, partial [Staphylococcus aureus]|nr:hypothetical protein [Staphylococcus aureus]
EAVRLPTTLTVPRGPDDFLGKKHATHAPLLLHVMLEEKQVELERVAKRMSKAFDDDEALSTTRRDDLFGEGHWTGWWQGWCLMWLS